MVTSLISRLVDRLLGQQDKGLEKYGVPVYKEAHSLGQWVEHELEEHTDALVYKQAQKETIAEIADLLHQAKSSTNMEDCHAFIQKAIARLE